MTDYQLNFVAFTLTGIDAQKFLQGQITCNTAKLGQTYQATAISNLKGRVEFGIWIKKINEQTFEVVISETLADSFANHIKKYGAFSKLTLSEPTPIFAVVENQQPTFSTISSQSADDWQRVSIAKGNSWITTATQGLFQPQELRLHQRGGVDYDKGCYLGQEIIARLYFKASPKAWLHRVMGSGIQTLPKAGDKLGKVDVVNAIVSENGQDFEALVVARPEDIDAAGLTVLALPAALQEPIGRNS